MDLLLEVIASIIFEGLIEGMKAKTIPMWIRIICTIIVGLIFFLIIGMAGMLAVIMWMKNLQLLSILFLTVDLIFIISAIKKVKEFIE